jgi:predicted ATPase
MQVIFKNTGILQEAEIRLDGLTVIAGENDTGKSTVGKLLFSIIKTFNRFEKDARGFQVLDIKNLCDDYYFKFRENIEDVSFYELGKTFFENLNRMALVLMEEDNNTKEKVETAISREINGFMQMAQGVSSSAGGIDLEDFKVRLAAAILKKPAREDVFKWTFTKYAFSVLNGEIANKYSDTDTYSITGKEGKTTIFKIEGSDDNPALQLNDRLYFEDATFFESPVLLNLADNIRFAKTEFDKNGELKEQAALLEKAYVPEYMRDLLLKLTDKVIRKDGSPTESAVRDIIKGKFHYDHRERDFVFEKGNRVFKGVSIASGIKYLGAFGILAQAGFLHKKSLLILDEPENHVHPEWQIKLAEAAVKAVQEGANILLTSHSPYMLEALKIFADQIIGEKKSAFYLSDTIPNSFMCRIDNLTHDISPIFELLSKPYRELEIIDARDIL